MSGLVYIVFVNIHIFEVLSVMLLYFEATCIPTLLMYNTENNYNKTIPICSVNIVKLWTGTYSPEYDYVSPLLIGAINRGD